MVITCVWCWTLLDLPTTVSDSSRPQNLSLDTLCNGQSHACWRSLGSCTIAVLFTVVRIFLQHPERENMHSFCAYIALTASNIVFEIGSTQNEIEDDFKLAKLPPCTIDQKITMCGVEYPIVRSHPVPNGIEWNAPWEVINRCLIILINLGHGR